MQQEKDFIQREIQRLSLLLTKLIGKALGLDTNDFEQEIQNIEAELKNEFDLTLREITEIKDSQLMEKIDGLDQQHLEKLVELIAAITRNQESGFGDGLAKKGILILDFLDRTSKTFSFNRMELKETLQQRL